ncbi:MAG TPA: hypothetical protein VIG89_07330 [Candidatus Acidoferrales bacterium]
MEEAIYRLEVEALDLGPDARAVGLELIARGTREPLTGPDAARIWAATLPALAGSEPWVLDFFAHLSRVRDFCRDRKIAFREPNAHTLVISALAPAPLEALLARFANERFGVRAGGPGIAGDPAVEGQLAARGVDAYHGAYPTCLFCAVCDFESGSLTVLSDRLWASEVIRRARPALSSLGVEVTRPA